MPDTQPNTAAAVRATFSPDQLLAAIVDSSDDAILSKALDGTITSWNQAAERIFGYAAAEAVGHKMDLIVPSEHREREAEVLAKIRDGERVLQYESVRQRKDGRCIDVSVTMSPVRGEHGRVVGASTIARDITMQKRSMDAANWLAAIVESSDDAIVGKNLNGIINSWNQGAERIFGWRADEIIGRSVLTLIPSDLQHEEAGIIARLKRGERIDHFRTIRRRKNGELFHASLTVSPIRDATGRIIGASKVARDITNEMKAMEQLAIANTELKRADKMKSEFLAMMSHELRTPLNSIIGFASVLRQDRRGVLDEDQKKQLNLIHTSGKHLLGLINDLLDLSRIEAGRPEIEPEEFSPDEAIHEAARTVELLATQKQLQIRYDLGAKAPVYTDRKRLTQIVLNLLSNAIKFTPRGYVLIQTRREGDHLRVAVTDTGIGIARDKQGALFQPFSQIESTTRRRYEGTGLGLYLSKKLVGLLGGEITLASELNRGSTFSFQIPAQLPAQPAGREETTEPAFA